MVPPHGRLRAEARPRRFARFVRAAPHISERNLPPTSSRGSRALLAGLLLVTALPIIGCRDAGSIEHERDSAGIRIIEHAPSTSLARWHADSQPRLRIGRADGDEAQQLFDVAGAARLSDGRIVVANSGTSELRWFGADGRHLSTTGRSGGGPGEFRRILRLMRMPGDSILILDPAAARLSVIDDSGRFVRSFRVPRLPQGQPTIRARFADGRLLGFMLNPDVIARPGLHVQRGTFYVFSDTGSAIDSIGVLAVNQAEAREREGRQSVFYWPFHASGFVGIAAERIVYAWSASPELLVSSDSGTLAQIVRLPDRPRAFTPALRQEEGARVAETRSPTLRPLFLRDWNRMDFPDSLPVYSAMVVDRSDLAWLQELVLGDPPHRRWLIVDPVTGQLQADVMLPGRLRVMEIGDDYVLGTIRDDVGVESLVLLDLARHPAGGRTPD